MGYDNPATLADSCHAVPHIPKDLLCYRTGVGLRFVESRSTGYSETVRCILFPPAYRLSSVSARLIDNASETKCTTTFKDGCNIKHGIHYTAARIRKLLANTNPLPTQINCKTHPNSYSSVVCPEDVRSLMRMRFLCFGLLAGRELYLSGSRCDHSGIALICCHMYFSSLFADFA